MLVAGPDDRVHHVAVDDGVVDASDRDRLRRVPVGGREGQAGRRDRPFGGVAGRQTDGHVGRRLGVQHREGCVAAASVVSSPEVGVNVIPACRACRCWSPRHPPRPDCCSSGPAWIAGAVTIVYATLPSSAASLTPVTVTVCGVSQLAGVNVRLAGGHRPLGGVAGRQSDGHVGRRLRVQHHGEGCRPARLRGHQVRGRIDPDPRAVSLSMFVTWGCTRIQIVVVRVVADRWRRDDLVRHVAVDIGIVTPVTVTICGVFQLAGVNVRLAGDTISLVVSLDDRSMVTAAVGWRATFTLKVAVPPASVVTSVRIRFGHRW